MPTRPEWPVKPSPQAGGPGRCLHPPADLPGREPEDRRSGIQQLLGRLDGQERLGGLPPDVEGHPLSRGVGLGAADLEEGGAVVAELHVAPGEGGGLGAAQQPVPEH